MPTWVYAGVFVVSAILFVCFVGEAFEFEAEGARKLAWIFIGLTIGMVFTAMWALQGVFHNMLNR